MNGGFLLDTNVISETIRPRPDLSVIRGFRLHADSVFTAAPVWHELLFGTLRLPPSLKRDVLSAWLHDVVRPTIPIKSYDAAAGRWHAEERARLSRAGKTPSFVDGQIAAIAKVNDLTLVTRNVIQYRVFRDLRIENWFGMKPSA